LITMNDEEAGGKRGNGRAISRRDFIKSATGLVGSEAAVFLPGQTSAWPSENRGTHSGGLMGNRFVTLNSVIRTKLIEYTRYGYLGKPGEWAYWDTNEHFRPEYLIRLRDAIAKGWPGGRITWSLTWGALFDERPNFVGDRKFMKTVQRPVHSFCDAVGRRRVCVCGRGWCRPHRVAANGHDLSSRPV
jgi:hypothetical protein